jgi:hypothetical protein
MTFEIYEVKLYAVLPLPDIAHQASAVTVLMDIQQKDRQIDYLRTWGRDTALCLG